MERPRLPDTVSLFFRVVKPSELAGFLIWLHKQPGLKDNDKLPHYSREIFNSFLGLPELNPSGSLERSYTDHDLVTLTNFLREELRLSYQEILSMAGLSAVRKYENVLLTFIHLLRPTMEMPVQDRPLEPTPAQKKAARKSIFPPSIRTVPQEPVRQWELSAPLWEAIRDGVDVWLDYDRHQPKKINHAKLKELEVDPEEESYFIQPSEEPKIDAVFLDHLAEDDPLLQEYEEFDEDDQSMVMIEWEQDFDIDDEEEDDIEEKGSIEGVDVDDPVELYFSGISEFGLLPEERDAELGKRVARGAAWKKYKRGLVAQRRLEEGDYDDNSQKAVLEERIQAALQAAEEFPELRQVNLKTKKVKLETGDVINLVNDAQEAREELARCNTRWVVKIAKYYIGQGLPFLDLIQEGNVGLMIAVDKFDYKRKLRFSTYATWWIRQKITRALSQKSRTIRVPIHMNDRIRRMYKVAQKLEQDLGRRPYPEEIAQEMELSKEKIIFLLNASRDSLALQEPVGEDGDSEVGDFIEDVTLRRPDQEAEFNSLKPQLRKMLNAIAPRDREIIELRYGLNGGGELTLEQIGQIMGVSRERIRYLLKESLKNLRYKSSQHQLREYL